MRTMSIALSLLAALSIQGCGSSDTPDDTASADSSFLVDEPVPERSLVSVLEERGDFRMLIDGIDAAGLGGVLRGSGPFTMLAPSDSAFNAMPQTQRAELFADSTRLARLLQYHVIPGILTAADLQGMSSVTTLEGTTVPVTMQGGELRIRDLSILVADIEADNGIVHVVNGVLVPR